MISEQEAESIKEQLLKQIESLPPEQAGQLEEQIEAMSPEELEQFLIKNNLMNNNDKKAGECIFCSIISGKVPSYKIDENKSSIAILEINPLSPGHSIIVSKKHDKLASSSFSLANKIAGRVKSKLKASEVKIETASLFGHHLMEIIPIYKDKKLEKKNASEQELILMQDKLKAKPKKKREKTSKVTEIKLEQAPRRVP